MKKVENAEPGVFELRAGANIVLILFGLPFALIGLTAVAAGLGAFPGHGPEQLAERVMVVVFGAVFASIGAAFMGGRRVLRIDRNERAVISWWGIFVPFRTRRRQLGESQRIELSKETQGSGKNRRTVFPVRLVDIGGERVTISANADYHESRRMAEDVARFLHQPMVDSSSGEEIVREAAYLDETVADRVRRLGERIELPQPPAQMASKFQMHSGSVEIELPKTANLSGLVGLVVMVMVSGMVAFVAFGIVSAGQMPDAITIGIGAFVALFLLLGVGGSLLKLRRGSGATKVSVTRAGLSVVRGGKTIEIPADELEELSVAGRDISQLLSAMPDGSATMSAQALDSPEMAQRMAGGKLPPTLGPKLVGVVRFFASMAPDAMAILARSDNATVRFGNGLDAQELAFLCAAITKVLSE